MNVPTEPGRFWLVVNGQKRLTKVFDQNNELYAVIGHRAVPVREVVGAWVTG